MWICYGIVLFGNVKLELDDGNVTSLEAGDIVAQRGTFHAWINRIAAPARVAFVLLDALPATANGQKLEPEADGIYPDAD